LTASVVTAPEFPGDGILWRGFDDDTLRLIAERDKPVLLFVANPDPLVWPFLRETFKAMPKKDRLRQLLHDDGCPRAVPQSRRASRRPQGIGRRQPLQHRCAVALGLDADGHH
jgi:hypothetical protein